MPEFNTHEDATAWLMHRSPQVATLIAARSALRVLPVLAKHALWDAALMDESRRLLPLSVFRATATSWFAGTWKELEPGVASAAADAVRLSTDEETWAGPLAARNAALAARSAARAAACMADRPVDRAAANGFAIDTLSAAKRCARFAVCSDSALFALNTDSAITNVSPAKFDPLTLSEAPIWRGGRMPELMSELWHDLKRQLSHLEFNEGWEVWADWYEARLCGAQADMEVEKNRITILHEKWGENPASINEAIKGLPPIDLKPAEARKGRNPRNGGSGSRRGR